MVINCILLFDPRFIGGLRRDGVSHPGHGRWSDPAAQSEAPEGQPALRHVPHGESTQRQLSLRKFWRLFQLVKHFFLQFSFLSTWYRGVIQTHLSRVAPDWDLWRTIYRLSYTAAAKTMINAKFQSGAYVAFGNKSIDSFLWHPRWLL